MLIPLSLSNAFVSIQDPVQHPVWVCTALVIQNLKFWGGGGVGVCHAMTYPHPHHHPKMKLSLGVVVVVVAVFVSEHHFNHSWDILHSRG